MVRITRCAPDLLDHDNLTATVELVLDRLVEMGGVIRGKSKADYRGPGWPAPGDGGGYLG